ncbi:hypothetical protein Cgig2_027167 [Carnegiea gigantea]|uniref:Uncharacterized protein n=1 Tax=Carnegiea gigantea TaxID=171969 RepID=A0A9Q1KSR1_9CARY|nr:hypothetical protein Cgig2_027167 [Carnegiea gigantea]
MRSKSLGSCKDERSSLWSHPSLSSVGAPSNHGSGYTATEFSKLDSIHRPDWGRVRELIDKKRVRRWSQRMRARPLGGRPHLRVVSSRGYSSIHLSRGSGIKYRESRGTPISVVSMAFPPVYNMREMTNYVRKSFIWRWRSASRLLRLLPKDFHALCPRFLLSKAERRL